MVKQNPDQVLTVEIETDHVVRDIDTMEELEQFDLSLASAFIRPVPSIGTSYKTSIPALAGETGCRRVVKQNPDQVLTVERETDHVVRDIDTMEEYERLIDDVS